MPEEHNEPELSVTDAARRGVRVLISAPNLLQRIDLYRDLLKETGWETLTAEVDERLDEDELAHHIQGIDGVICGDDPFTPAVLQHADKLKVIVKWGTGTDSIDHQAAAARGIPVYNTPGAFTDPVADSVMGYILAFARKIPWIDTDMKAGRWEKHPARSLSECKLGIIGLGNIGQAVARRAHAFGMKVLANDIREIDPDVISRYDVHMTDKRSVVKAVDFLTLHCDLNPGTRGLVDASMFAAMRASAVLINTARGPMVDEASLIGALRSGQIAGAALDVFENEPLDPGSPLRSFDNVILSPHNTNNSDRAWDFVSRHSIEMLQDGLRKHWR